MKKLFLTGAAALLIVATGCKGGTQQEKELAALFNTTSIPLLVFIPQEGTPQLFPGAADKDTYKKVIDEFLLKQ